MGSRRRILRLRRGNLRLLVAAAVFVTGCSGAQNEASESDIERPPPVEFPSGRSQSTSGLPLTLEAWPAPREGTRAAVLTDGEVDGVPFESAPETPEPWHLAFSLPDAPIYLAAVVVWKTEASLRVEVRSFLGATPIVADNFDGIREASTPQGGIELPAGGGPFVLELSEPAYAHHFWISVSEVPVVHGITEMSALTAAGLRAIKESSIEVLLLQHDP